MLRQDRLEDKDERSLFEEFSRGIFSDVTRAYYVDLIGRLAGENVSAVVLGCTELPLILSAEDANIPLFDTAELHALAAADLALA